MKHVMIVDDHAPVIRVMRMGLEAAGFRVSAARNGQKCLDALASELPDFLVTDIDMPVMTGRELCQAIQSTYPDRQFPIVVLTSRTELEHRTWTSKMSNLSFMEKPVSIKQLIADIQLKLSDDFADTGS